MAELCLWTMSVSQRLAGPSFHNLSCANSPGSLWGLAGLGARKNSSYGPSWNIRWKKELFRSSACQNMSTPDSMFSSTLCGSFISSCKWWNVQGFLWRFIPAPVSKKDSTVHFKIKILPLFSSFHYSWWYLRVALKNTFPSLIFTSACRHVGICLLWVNLMPIHQFAFWSILW